MFLHTMWPRQPTRDSVLILYELLGLTESLLQVMLTGSLPAEGSFISRDILVCFLDFVVGITLAA